MLPLDGSELPASLDLLKTALRRGMENHGLTVRTLEVDGSAYPAGLEQIKLDLSGSSMQWSNPLPKAVGPAGAGFPVGRIEVVAAPVSVEGVPISIQLEASRATLALCPASDGKTLLELTQSGPGRLVLSAEHSALEAALQKAVAAAAAKQGAEIKQTRLHLAARGPRGLDFRAEITAKVFVMTALLVVSGQADLDDELNLRLHHMEASGEGMIASLASGALRPRFAELEKKPIPLARLSFAGVSLRDVRLDTSTGLRLEAQFGA